MTLLDRRKWGGLGPESVNVRAHRPSKPPLVQIDTTFVDRHPTLRPHVPSDPRGPGSESSRSRVTSGVLGSWFVTSHIPSHKGVGLFTVYLAKDPFKRRWHKIDSGP